MKIAFIIGDAAISGGTYVILQHALYLKQHAHDITIYYHTYNCKSWHEAFDHIKFHDIKQYNDKDMFDIAIATWWQTVFDLEKIQAKRKCYFVQSIESFFEKDSNTEIKKSINSTYSINLPVITEATWIKDYLFKKYNTAATIVRNGIRKDFYYPNTKSSYKNRILIEGPVHVDFKNVPRTIYLCKKHTNCELWLLTSSDIKSFHGVSKIFSRVPASETGDIYRECDFIVKLSYVEGMFAPPLEMFHCGGTAIVYNVTGHDEYMINNENSLIVKEGDELSVINALKKLENDHEFLEKLKNNALKTASCWPDWNESSKHFDAALLNIPEVMIDFKNLYPIPSPKKQSICLKIYSKIKQFIQKHGRNIIYQYIYTHMPNRGKRIKDI